MKLAKYLSVVFLCTAIFAAPSSAFAGQQASENVLEDMFVWWNGAFKQPGAFTPEAFGQHFTKDAVMRINGRVTARGLDELAVRFQFIQGQREVVEMLVPFEEKFISEDGNKVFTHHFVRSRGEGDTEDTVVQVMGYAVIENGKIAVVDFLHFAVEHRDPLHKN